MDALEFPWKDPPKPGCTLSIVEGLTWSSMPLPFALDHVNIWQLRDHDSVAIIDAGLNTRQTQQYWHQLQPNSGGKLIVTHYHPDHIGLAGWLQKNFNLSVSITEGEWEVAHRAISAESLEFGEQQDQWFSLHGLDETRRDIQRKAGNTYRPVVKYLPERPDFVADGERLNINDVEWLILTVGGHAPEMICLYSEEHSLLIAADHVLPEISPNISLNFYSSDSNPMHSFIESLQRMKNLPEDVLVLPSHGRPFRGLHARVEQLIQHHRNRFALLQEQCFEPKTATDMLPVLFRRHLDDQQLMFGMGESIAHLQYLTVRGDLTAQEIAGVRHYTCT